MATQVPALPTSTAQSNEFEYVFPAIKGIQAGREYYVTMCPLRLIPRLFIYDEEELPPEMRAQRSLNKTRVPEIARYIVDNPDSYTFSALTASVSAAVRFDTLTEENSPTGRVGTLAIPMEAKFVINDGQHRRAAIQQALTESPDIGDETIAIVMFIDAGLSRCQQMFADLNRYAIRPAKSIGVLYDHRDPLAAVSRLVITQSLLLNDLTEMETSNLAVRSRKLFTLSAFHTANTALLDQVETETLTERVDLAANYWKLVADQFPSWQQVHRGEVTAGEVRRDFIHTHSIVLHALGKVGNTLLRESQEPSSWKRHISRLRKIDWHRNNREVWEGRATLGGKVTKSRANVVLTTAYIRSAIGLRLPPDEQAASTHFNQEDRS
ncbi:DNA sulfur modification protein DndB [Gordonia sputi]|uniref:DNA sulfur modification protein DndB n=1 Tax=Gordonia sputi NBRC 100414 TaxID=1089453 RepID=H5U2Y0_9ACTN|nr:DNA sulfur modification protein DndB [Gordonia sputi]NKY95897.1 DNA sulfur modification protein DndB [Gordonia sputi]GAB40088.1 hypothetical protein GOSPT_088_00020 [Gordonia sputi NBRC 100414]